MSTSTGQIINPDGVANISFTVNDANGNLIVDQGEISNVAFSFTDFADTRLNFSSTDFSFTDRVGVPNSGGLRPLGATGFTWEGVNFEATGGDGLIRRVTLTTLSLGIAILDPNAFIAPFVTGDVANNPVFASGTGAPPPSEVPLPAAAPLMAFGLAGLGLFKSKKRQAGTGLSSGGKPAQKN
ncbi:MAG: VPLPA-CTERM sorting domain-containing protein [Pseudomonadota bacterium]